MISFWLLASPADVESYAATLILPPYLAHLQLERVDFAAQAVPRDGREPLVLRYAGLGRLEEYPLDPQQHALGMIALLCPQIELTRLQLPRDDANWFWPPREEPQPALRIYFSPTAAVLGQSRPRPQPANAYVSVSRGHAFISTPIVRDYLQAWLRHLGLPPEPLDLECGSASGGIEFRAGRIGGQLFIDAPAVADDLAAFAGLAPALAEVAAAINPDQQPSGLGRRGAFADGVYLPLRIQESAATPRS